MVYFGKAFLTFASDFLHEEQTLVVAGCFDGGKALGLMTSGVQVCPELTSDAEESDSIVWLHVFHSAGQRKLFVFP